jgi:hypothetical protein
MKMSKFFPTSQPVSLRFKIVKFTGLQVPRVQSGVAFLFVKEWQFHVGYGFPF